MIATVPITMDALAECLHAEQADPAIHRIATQFHTLSYYSEHTWPMTRWRGVPVLKMPLDLWIYQEIIEEIRPALIIETGTAFGGSALFFADLLCLHGPDGRVVTIDREEMNLADIVQGHPRIIPIHGDSSSATIIQAVSSYVQAARGPILVTLDSDHNAPHVRAELDAYAPFVTSGSMLIIEDTNLGHIVKPEVVAGPREAVETWLPTHPEFARNVLCERYFVTFSTWLVHR